MTRSRYDDLGDVWDERAFKTAADVTDSPWKWVVGGLLGFAALCLVVFFVGWQIGWWYTNQNINRESHALRNSYGNQQTLRDQITANIGNVLDISTQIAETANPGTAAGLKAQRVAVVNIVCGDAAQVVGDPLSSDQQSFISANCEAGNIKPGSAYTH